MTRNILMSLRVRYKVSVCEYISPVVVFGSCDLPSHLMQGGDKERGINNLDP